MDGAHESKSVTDGNITAAADPFALLPDELISMIIVATNDVRAVARFGQTCRRMQCIASDDSVWRLLYVALHGGQRPMMHERRVEFGKDWRWLCRARMPAARGEKRVVVGTIVDPPSGRTFAGDLYEGFPHGYGCASWTGGGGGGKKAGNLVAYEGRWLFGAKHGRGGVCVWRSGERYEGDWVGDKRHGKGTMWFPDGSIYRGQWSHGAMHGRGVRTGSGGDRYEGEWAHNKKHGRGTYTASNGQRHEGKWVDGNRQSHWVSIHPDSDTAHHPA